MVEPHPGPGNQLQTEQGYLSATRSVLGIRYNNGVEINLPLTALEHFTVEGDVIRFRIAQPGGTGIVIDFPVSHHLVDGFLGQLSRDMRNAHGSHDPDADTKIGGVWDGPPGQFNPPSAPRPHPPDTHERVEEVREGEPLAEATPPLPPEPEPHPDPIYDLIMNDGRWVGFLGMTDTQRLGLRDLIRPREAAPTVPASSGSPLPTPPRTPAPG